MSQIFTRPFFTFRPESGWLVGQPIQIWSRARFLYVSSRFSIYSHVQTHPMTPPVAVKNCHQHIPLVGNYQLWQCTHHQQWVPLLPSSRPSKHHKIPPAFHFCGIRLCAPGNGLYMHQHTPNEPLAQYDRPFLHHLWGCQSVLVEWPPPPRMLCHQHYWRWEQDLPSIWCHLFYTLLYITSSQSLYVHVLCLHLYCFTPPHRPSTKLTWQWLLQNDSAGTRNGECKPNDFYVPVYCLLTPKP